MFILIQQPEFNVTTHHTHCVEMHTLYHFLELLRTSNMIRIT